MLYKILYFPARIAIHFYCKYIRINKPDLLTIKGPVILACNHPNSFLDAIVLATIFKEPIYSLARGDAFVSDFVNRLLKSLHMLPVYRISEGNKNLKNNYNTFDKVHELLKQDKIVLVFSEGLCVNEWHLRPLKKGTARMAFSAWEDNIHLKVLPVGINYSSFRHFGKGIKINFGNVITQQDFANSSSGLEIRHFNSRLTDELSGLVYEIKPEDYQKRKETFGLSSGKLTKLLLSLPAAIGYLIHAPLFYLLAALLRKRNDVHFDSIMVGLMLFTYPVYLSIITIILYIITGSWLSLLAFLFIPVTALALLHNRDVL